MVTEQQLRDFLKLHGWGFRWRTVDNLRVAYAQRRVGKRVITRYLISESKLDNLTEGDVEKRIQLSE